MVEVDRSDRAGNGADHIGRVKAAAESDFDDADLHARPAEHLEGRGRGRLEKRRLHAQDARRAQTVGAAQHVLDRRLEQGGSTGAIVDDESLGEIVQMGRRVSAGPNPGGSERRVCHGGDRTLAVRACDMQRSERALRMPERLAEQRDIVEAQLDAERLERE